MPLTLKRPWRLVEYALVRDRLLVWTLARETPLLPPGTERTSACARSRGGRSAPAAPLPGRHSSGIEAGESPGTSWDGAVIEKVSGKSYEDFIEQEIFAPLGMKSSRYGHQREVIPGRVAGYDQTADGGYQIAEYLSMTQPYAAGSLMSTVDDLALWAEALAGGKVVSGPFAVYKHPHANGFVLIHLPSQAKIIDLDMQNACKDAAEKFAALDLSGWTCNPAEVIGPDRQEMRNIPASPWRWSPPSMRPPASARIEGLE